MSAGVTTGSYSYLRHPTGAGCGACLVVVVHDVDLTAARSAIAAVASPVVNHVVAHVHAFVGLSAGARP